ncbi:hypothetical protein JXB41_01550 [Candidatus Woesearchaeota archaeon]|nr:hypothetical protein [Candidatus Woesearchaeota archaeon]
MKKIIIFVLSVLLFLNFICFSSAEKATANAYITLEIINDIPEIQNAVFDSSIYYEDSALRVKTVVKDEFPEQLEFHYKWFVNNDLVSKEDSLEYEFEPGDEIICIITAEDPAHQYSNSVTVHTKINKSPASSVVIKKTMLLVGIKDIRTEEVRELQEKGLMSVTGFVVSEADYSVGGFSTIILLVILLLLVTLNITLRIRINKYASE